METKFLIESTSVFLGLLTPFILYLLIRRGIQNSMMDASKKKTASMLLTMLITAWVLGVASFTIAGIFAYQDGDVIPRFLIALLLPLSVGIYMFTRKDFRDIVANIPLKWLVGGQFWRLFGAIFIVVAISGLGPASMVNSGYGDMLTGALALFAFWALLNGMKIAKTSVWLFTLVGLMDLTIILILLLGNYPIWSMSNPDSSMMVQYPLMLIVGLAAPVALMMHMMTVRKLLTEKT
jgi:hypothetical protein